MENGDIVDAHLLVGLEAWQRGPAANVMNADGLLDIYRAVVWEFLELKLRRGFELGLRAISFKGRLR